MLNEQPVMIWDPTQNKWVSTLIYFTDQPAQTTNIQDIDGAGDASQSAGTAGPQGIQGVAGPQGIQGIQGVAGVSTNSSSALNPTSGYQESLPLGSIFPTTEIWYVDSSKTQKIAEKDITWVKAVPTVILYKTYDTDGITIKQEIRDNISYTKNIIPINVTRTIII